QAVAAELNLPATAFLWRELDRFALRWFTPLGELALCGHGTLAAAHVLWEETHLGRGELARFGSPAGILTARTDDGWVALGFPAPPPAPVEPPAELVRALGVAPIFVGRNRHDYLVAVATEAEVRALRPDLELLRAVDTRGVTVTAPASTP